MQWDIKWWLKKLTAIKFNLDLTLAIDSRTSPSPEFKLMAAIQTVVKHFQWMYGKLSQEKFLHLAPIFQGTQVEEVARQSRELELYFACVSYFFTKFDIILPMHSYSNQTTERIMSVLCRYWQQLAEIIIFHTETVPLSGYDLEKVIS